jgi:hypothetical protein
MTCWDKIFVALGLFGIFIAGFVIGHIDGQKQQYDDMKEALGIKEILFQTRMIDNKTYVMYVTRKGEEIVVDY